MTRHAILILALLAGCSVPPGPSQPAAPESSGATSVRLGGLAGPPGLAGGAPRSAGGAVGPAGDVPSPAGGVLGPAGGAAGDPAGPIAPNPPTVIVQPGEVPGPGVGPEVAGIIGKLKSPAGVIVANSGLGLVSDLGAGFRLFDVAASLPGAAVAAADATAGGAATTGDAPVAGARVTLVDADDKPLTDEVATSEADGTFRFTRVPSTTFFVHAAFEAAGQPVVLRALGEPAPDSALDVDPATTLAAAKLALLMRRGQLPRDAKARARFVALAAKVRATLGPETLPFMGASSRDLVAAFDQLALDDAAIASEARAIAAGAPEPAAPWAVTTVTDSEQLRALGVLSQGAAFTTAGGVFAIGADGRPCFATDTTPVRIMRLGEDGQATEFARLPAEILPPVSMAFSPDGGTLHVAGLDARKALWTYSGTGGLLTRAGGGPFFRTRDEDALAELGRLAVDAQGRVYVPLPPAQLILVVRPGELLPRRVAGILALPGQADGPVEVARFRRPTSLAFGPDGALYVADTNNASIRRVTLGPDGLGVAVSTVIGRPGEALYRNGRGAYARIGRPTGVAVAADGTLFLTDAGSHRVRRASPQGSVFLVAGTGELGETDGAGPQASFGEPSHLALAPDGSIYLADGGGARERLRRLTAPATE